MDSKRSTPSIIVTRLWLVNKAFSVFPSNFPSSSIVVTRKKYAPESRTAVSTFYEVFFLSLYRKKNTAF